MSTIRQISQPTSSDTNEN